MKTLKKYLAALMMIVTSATPLFSQDAEMADVMRSEGKIYVVVAIILIVLAGFLLYLFLQDRRLNKIERLLKERDKPNG